MHGLRIKAVVHRAVAVADACMRAGRQRCTHIVASTLHGPQHVGPQCQVRRDGGRKRAAGAVGVAGVDACVGEDVFAAIGQQLHVAEGVARHVPALDEHR